MRNICIILSFCIIFLTVSVFGQSVYKTPSGEKYHLSSCRMVENVSKKLLGQDDIKNYNLEPCKICKPPAPSQLNASSSLDNKAVGLSESVRCKGTTQAGTHCKHMTRLANGYYYQHTSQNSTSTYRAPTSTPTITPTCGARTKSGSACKRKVKGGGRCFQHDGRS